MSTLPTTPEPTAPNHPPPFQFSLRRMLVIVTCASVLLALLFNSIRAVRTQVHRGNCSNHLRSIAIALQNYHDTYDCFPPPYHVDKNGKPMHSWRVLIMPFLESSPFYSQYRFDEPWNGPNNRRLSDAFIRWFHCPADTRSPDEHTSYLAVVGDGTLFPPDRLTSLDDIADGANQSLMVVEVRNSGIHWMEPRDLDISDLRRGVNPKNGLGISSNHIRPSGAFVAYADGRVKFLPSDTLPEDLVSRATIAGGETIRDDD
jgi:hypothetical protein